MSLRGAFLAAAAICAGLLGFAYYQQYVNLLDPSPLCLLQRFVFYLIGALFLLGALHNPGRAGAWAYALLIGVGSLLGVATAARHLWLQSLPASQVPECAPGLEYMLELWPLAEVLGGLLLATGECARVDWTFLGLSMPFWSLVWYLLLAAWAVFAVAKARPKRRRIFLDH